MTVLHLVVFKVLLPVNIRLEGLALDQTGVGICAYEYL